MQTDRRKYPTPGRTRCTQKPAQRTPQPIELWLHWFLLEPTKISQNLGKEHKP